MIRNKKISSAFVLALILLITHHSLLITVLHAVTVDFYQDCESGNNGDVLTEGIMSASSHGVDAYGWSTSAGSNMWVSTNHVKRLPGTVTVGGTTYTDTGTRTWAVNDKYSLRFVRLWIGSSWPGKTVSHVTLACYLTIGPTTYVYNNFDTIIMEYGGTYVVLQQINGSYAGGPFVRGHGSGNPQVTPSIKVVSGKTYWINLKFDGSSMQCLAAVFDPDTWTQVGDTVTCPMNSPTLNLPDILFGRADNHGDNLDAETQTYFDNILIDYTNARFPLLPDIAGVDTTAPSAPGTVRDGSAAGVDVSSTTSRTQLSANWSASTDNESGITNYQFSVGTTPGGTQTSGWATIGNVLTVTKIGLSLSVGTTYYFSVKAVNGAGLTGNATNSNGQVVISTAVADTTPPSAPGAVRDGATAGGDISSTTSRTQLSANWTAATDNESGIANYQFAIGTTSGGTNVVPWTAMGNVLTVTKTGLSLTIGTTYYFSVKATNGAGLTGNATNSNGQVVISTAVADTTPPSAPASVKDGATAGTDDSFTYSTTTLSANWTASTDNESGITNYQFSIGTTPGGTQTSGWATIGNVLSVTKTGLTLTVGTTYYFSVKATNGQGLTGNAGNSNGQYVNAINAADTTPPSNITVIRDGTGADMDYTDSTTELSANWNSSADAESGIARYYFAIGSSPGATDITGWTPTDNGELTSVTQTGLSLVIGTTYYFSVKAENGVGLQSTPANSDGVCIISGELPPVISDVQSTNITANSATISWTTDKQATSQVEYGLTAVYGDLTVEDTNLAITHSVAIVNLTAGKTYHYRVISKDSNDNQSVSVDFTFTTLSTLNPQPSSSAYPNPYSLSRPGGMKFNFSGQTGGEVSIYTMSGKLVKKLSVDTGAGINWNGTNEDGEKAARGIYVYTLISNNGDKIIGKLAIIQ